MNRGVCTVAVFDFSSADVLLDIDAVCRKLCISRSSLERLRRIQQNSMPLRSEDLVGNDDFAGATPFPEPTLVLGRSSRWSARVLNEWIEVAASAHHSLLKMKG